MNEAKLLYGEDRADAATIEELKNCIEKDVWDFLPKDYKSSSVIPSKMFLTPKKKPNGEIERIKGRIVAGGHRQDRSLFSDNDISSPTVALTSVLATAALAAHNNLFVMSLDHKAAYLNAKIEGPPVEKMLDAGVVEVLCLMDLKYKEYVRADKRITVRLKKALYGCIQSALLW